MYSSLKKIGWIGVIFVVIVGTLWHFVYNWSGENFYIGLIAPVNESVWEHMKLIFFPALIFLVFEYFILGKDIVGFLPSKAIGLLASMLSMVVLFYTYSGILGKDVLAIDIAIFFISVIIYYLVSMKLIIGRVFQSYYTKYLGLFLLVLMTAAFIYFTINPPQIGMFMVE